MKILVLTDDPELSKELFRFSNQSVSVNAIIPIDKNGIDAQFYNDFDIGKVSIVALVLFRLDISHTPILIKNVKPIIKHGTKWVLLSNTDFSSYIGALIYYGFRSILHVSIDALSLIEALENVNKGRIFVDKISTKRIASYVASYKYAPDNNSELKPAIAIRHDLNKREAEITMHLLNEKTYKEIAAMLFISINTVRFHIKSIYEKVGVHSRSALIKVAKNIQ